MELGDEVRRRIVDYLKSRDAGSIAVFGSYARGENDQGSDIDILVEFSEPKSLLDVMRYERELSDVLGVEVDLVTEDSLSPYIYERVSDESVVLA